MTIFESCIFFFHVYENWTTIHKRKQSSWPNKTSKLLEENSLLKSKLNANEKQKQTQYIIIH